MPDKVVIGTRGSKLALWQAHFTRDKFEQAGFEIDIQVIKTKGDQIQDLSFDKIEGKGFFTKEIETALLEKEIDLAVHSCKDLPTESTEGLIIGAYSYRAAPHDVLLIRKDSHDSKLTLEIKRNGIIGTSSSRRKAQLLTFRKDFQLKDIRGNVPTRINKLREGHYDAIVLAAAGLDRLQLDTNDLIRIDLSPTMFIPAPAQGILAYQIRSNDERMKRVVQVLNDAQSFEIAEIERKVLHDFQGGCQMPLGVYAKKENNEFHVWVSKADGWDEIPKRRHFSFCDLQSIEKIVPAFKKKRSANVFISRDLTSDDYLQNNLEALGYQLSGEAFIEFTSVPFHIDYKEMDWLFFSSKNAVKYFFEGITKFPEHLKLAAINEGSAMAIKQLGYFCDFIGRGGNMEKIASEFDKMEGQNVLFPQAKHSNKTIQSLLKDKRSKDLVVYDNFAKNQFNKRQEEVLIFTSPLNVTAYFEKFTLEKDQKLIAIGSSTNAKLMEYNYKSIVAYEPTMWALLDCVLAI